MLVNSRSFFGYVFFGLSACGGRGEEPLQDPAPASGAPTVVSVTADKQTYGRDEVIELTLELRNNSDGPLVLEFTSGQRYDFAIVGAQGDTAWSWSAGRNFPQFLGQETVQPDQGLLYREQVRPELATGTFRIVGRITARGQALADTTVIVVQ